ncbi:MAG: hypothetical protein ACR2RB_21065 [Gammaproteobacteria bacterium]
MTASTDRARVLVADEAARIILDEGVKDYQLAKHKAAARLGFTSRRALPRNTEIERAVLSRRALFDAETHDLHLRELRQTALQAMQLFENFNPRLVGSVLKGTAGARSNINLHLFADTVEDVIFLLTDANIPYQSKEKRLRLNGAALYYPALEFMADKVEIEAVIMPPDNIRQAPLCPIDGRPMRRATLTEVKGLVGAS